MIITTPPPPPPCTRTQLHHTHLSTHSLLPSLFNNTAIVNVTEGQEPAEFWPFLGGKGAYAATSKGYVHRLILCSPIMPHKNSYTHSFFLYYLYFRLLHFLQWTFHFADTLPLLPLPSLPSYFSVFSSGPLPRDARLFQASTASGSFKVEEVANFDQSDLLQGTHTHTHTHLVTANCFLVCFTVLHCILIYCLRLIIDVQCAVSYAMI